MSSPHSDAARIDALAQAIARCREADAYAQHCRAELKQLLLDVNRPEGVEDQVALTVTRRVLP